MSEKFGDTRDTTSWTEGFLRVRPTGAALGAEVQGIDLRALDADAFAAIHQAWLDHQVLLFRDQVLSDDDLVAFSRRFGDLDEAPVQETGRRFVEGHPEIYVVSNVLQDGVAIGSLGAGEAVWHTDMSYLPSPPKASVLYALEVPPSGGDTSFCSMYAAWDALPDALRRRVDGARVKHDGTYNSGGYTRQGVTPTDDPRTSPGTLHPLVYVHPETGRSGLYLGRRRNAYIEGMSLEESERAARRDLGVGDARRADVATPVARRRPRVVGQPVHDAPPRRLRSGRPPRDAPHADPRRQHPDCRRVIEDCATASCCGTRGSCEVRRPRPAPSTGRGAPCRRRSGSPGQDPC